MMHRKQVSTQSHMSDTNDCLFSDWVLTILTSELVTPQHSSSLDTDHQIMMTMGFLSPLSLTQSVQSSPRHHQLPTLSDIIRTLIWTILPCQPLKS